MNVPLSKHQRLRKLDAQLAHLDLSLSASETTGLVENWFLGPRAENEPLLTQLITDAIAGHAQFRRAFHPEDPVRITPAIKSSAAFKAGEANFKRAAAELNRELQGSAPVSSMRSVGHMLWDQVLPGMVGYFSGMLYNQNNVAAEASPVTTRLEIEVGNDLCRMLGFHPAKKGTSQGGSAITAWGHIVCDGSVANAESLWAARNAKFFALALRNALREAPALSAARPLEVRLLNGQTAALADLDTWPLLNLRLDDVIVLPNRILTQYGIPLATTAAALAPYSVQMLGLVEFYARYMSGCPFAPVATVPATKHYSWPKAATLLGLGQHNLLNVSVDLNARQSIAHLDMILQTCLQRHVPVLAVVAVIGSTEENAVDPLVEILALRENYRAQGLDFIVHCDAAWGGYFRTMLNGTVPAAEPNGLEAPELAMKPYARQQFEALGRADSITVDPHKAGYIPYPAGALCYRNAATRDLISLKSPVVFHSQSEPTVGVYGIEGSKPGAAAAAVYLAHRVIRPDRSGYGRILGQCMWTSNRMCARFSTIEDKRFKLVVFQRLPAEAAGAPAAVVKKQRDYIRRNFVKPRNRELLELLRANATARTLFGELGSDGVILAYSFNFYEKSGRLNRDIEKMNQLTDRVFSLCSLMEPAPSMADLNKLDLIVTSSSFDPASYGQPFVDDYARRLGVTPKPGVAISFLISTAMDPWETDTFKGGRDFLEAVEDALRQAVYTALKQLQF